MSTIGCLDLPPPELPNRSGLTDPLCPRPARTVFTPLAQPSGKAQGCPVPRYRTTAQYQHQWLICPARNQRPGRPLPRRYFPL